MTIEEAKLELKDYINNKKWLEERLNDIEERRTTLEKITTTLSSEPKGTPKMQDKVAEILAGIIDDTDRFERYLLDLKEKQIHIENKIDKLEQPYKTILYSLYIRGKTLVTVASEMNYNYTWMCEMHGKALKKYSNIAE